MTQIHLVSLPDIDEKYLNRMALGKLRSHFVSVCAGFDVELIEMDDVGGHVHLLINNPPKLAISNLVNSLKGVSGRLHRRDRPDIAQRYTTKVFC